MSPQLLSTLIVRFLEDNSEEDLPGVRQSQRRTTNRKQIRSRRESKKSKNSYKAGDNASGDADDPSTYNGFYTDHVRSLIQLEEEGYISNCLDIINLKGVDISQSNGWQ